MGADRRQRVDLAVLVAVHGHSLARPFDDPSRIERQLVDRALGGQR
jgi:hypothetical protein